MSIECDWTDSQFLCLFAAEACSRGRATYKRKVGDNLKQGTAQLTQSGHYLSLGIYTCMYVLCAFWVQIVVDVS